MFTLLLLTVCFSLAVGSTYAQNTASDESTPVTFSSGSIQAKLEWSKDLAAWDEFDSADVVFGDNVSWEPGYTEARYFKVENGGDIDFKYSFTVTCDTTNKLAEVIDVYSCPLPAAKFTDRNALLTSAKYLGTLKNLSGTALVTKDKLAKEATDGFTVVLSMQQNAGNSYQNLSLKDITITVTATQITDNLVH